MSKNEKICKFIDEQKGDFFDKLRRARRTEAAEDEKMREIYEKNYSLNYWD